MDLTLGRLGDWLPITPKGVMFFFFLLPYNVQYTQASIPHLPAKSNYLEACSV